MTAMLVRSADPAPAWTAAWCAALAELECDVDEAEELIRVGHATGPEGPAWLPPSDLGQLPASLRDRAQALVARQLRVAQSLTEAAEQSRRHIRVIDQLRAAPESLPVYLDAAG
jgi:hypothetical protein